MREKREHPRKPIELDVECRLQDGSTMHGRSRDLSVGGMYVVVEGAQPPFGSTITLRVVGAAPELALSGVVRWAKPDGFGVQFGLLGAKETHAITRLMAGAQSQRFTSSGPTSG